MGEEQSDSDEDSVPEEYSILKMKSRRKSRALQDTFKNNDDAFDDAHKDSSDSDPDFDPEDFEEVRPTARSVRCKPLIMNLKNFLRRRGRPQGVREGRAR